MPVSESNKVQLDWLMKEYEINFALFRMYQLMRGTLMLGALAGIGVLTTIYRESIRIFGSNDLSASGLLTYKRSLIPEPLAVTAVSLVLLLLTVWVIFCDMYLGGEQTLARNRCTAIEMRFMGRGQTFRHIGGLQRRYDVFDLGRGILILLSLLWVVTFGVASYLGSSK